MVAIVIVHKAINRAISAKVRYRGVCCHRNKQSKTDHESVICQSVKKTGIIFELNFPT